MDPSDRQEALAKLDRDQVDPEFLPYLDRINGLPFVASMQCCAGHIAYREDEKPPADSSGSWGYLVLLLDMDLAMWLNDRILELPWLFVQKSVID